MSTLEGKVALITGASRGIGKDVAAMFAQAGARVVITARTLEEGSHQLAGSLNTTVDEIRAAGGEISAVAGDLSQYEACEAAVQHAHDTYGPIDVLVNNAVVSFFGPLWELKPNRWVKATEVNFNAPFFLSQLCLNQDMIPRRSGAIINIASAAAIGPGRGPYPQEVALGETMYGAHKAAIERFTQGLAAEVYKYGITVACLSPSGVVPTPGVVFHGIDKLAQEGVEPGATMARAIMLLATEPVDKVSGRVTYSQRLLQEYGELTPERGEARGFGFEMGSSGFSRM